jgi:hypothetical protein
MTNLYTKLQDCVEKNSLTSYPMSGNGSSVMRTIKVYFLYKVCNSIQICLFVLGFTPHRHSIGHIATFQLQLVEEDLRCPSVHYFRHLSGFEPTAVRGKWFEVNDHNHSATDAPIDHCMNVELHSSQWFSSYAPGNENAMEK